MKIEKDLVCGQALPILAVDSPGGVDVYWLNNPMGTGRPGELYWRKGVSCYEDIQTEMERDLPQGSTPLEPVLRAVRDKYTKSGPQETYMHCMVFLDGEPDGREAGKKRCRSIIVGRPNPEHNIMNFVACTDDDDEIKWLNGMDKYPGIDIADDFGTEEKEVLRAGRVKRFGYPDYVVKACIGAASKKIDRLDEPSFGRRVQLFFLCR